MNIRSDGMMLGSKKLRSHPNAPVKLTITQGLLFLSCSNTIADETSVFVLSSYFDFYRAIRLDSLNGLFAADAMFSRFQFVPVGDPPPPPPPMWFMFIGSGTSKELSI